MCNIIPINKWDSSVLRADWNGVNLYGTKFVLNKQANFFKGHIVHLFHAFNWAIIFLVLS